ncbi:MAG TPA: MFS transporter [Kofleriaceae bacterium]|nr:MFS transporter [Kofleriaceae bacterium]
MTTKAWWREPTRAQWMSFLAAWLGWVLDAFDFTIYLLVMKDIAAETHVGITAVSGSITLTLLVRLAGGACSGWMADRWGRKLPLMLSLLWFAAFDSAIYFAATFQAILILRTLFGFGMGAEWAAGTAMAMESWPANSRKVASGLLQAGWPVGFLLAALVAYFVVPALGWRAMFLIAAVPALLVVPIRMLVPEQPSWPNQPRTVRASALRELAAPGVLRMIVLGSLVMALGFIVYYGLTSQYALMLATELHLGGQSAFLHVIAFNIGMLVGVILAGIVANRWGVIVALVAPALLMVPAIPLFVGAVPGLLGVGAFLGGLLGVGYSGVTPVLTTGLFPEHVRARAIGIVYHVGALVAAFVPTLIAWLATTGGLKLSSAIALVCAVGLVAMSLAVLVLRREIVPPELAAPGERPRYTPVPSPARGSAPALTGAAPRERGVELRG